MKIINRKALLAALIMSCGNGVLAMDADPFDGTPGRGAGGGGSGDDGRGWKKLRVADAGSVGEVAEADAPAGAGGASAGGGSGAQVKVPGIYNPPISEEDLTVILRKWSWNSSREDSLANFETYFPHIGLLTMPPKEALTDFYGRFVSDKTYPIEILWKLPPEDLEFALESLFIPYLSPAGSLIFENAAELQALQSNNLQSMLGAVATFGSEKFSQLIHKAFKFSTPDERAKGGLIIPLGLNEHEKFEPYRNVDYFLEILESLNSLSKMVPAEKVNEVFSMAYQVNYALPGSFFDVDGIITYAIGFINEEPKNMTIEDKIRIISVIPKLVEVYHKLGGKEDDAKLEKCVFPLLRNLSADPLLRTLSAQKVLDSAVEVWEKSLQELPGECIYTKRERLRLSLRIELQKHLNDERKMASMSPVRIGWMSTVARQNGATVPKPDSVRVVEVAEHHKASRNNSSVLNLLSAVRLSREASITELSIPDKVIRDIQSTIRNHEDVTDSFIDFLLINRHLNNKDSYDRVVLLCGRFQENDLPTEDLIALFELLLAEAGSEEHK